MSDRPIEQQILHNAGIEMENANDREVPEAQPSFKMVGAARIPVSSKRGNLWRSRVNQARKAMEPHIKIWDEAISYYENSQDSIRKRSNPNRSDNSGSTDISDDAITTENVVYSNIMSLLPQLYAKNPTITMSSNISDDATQEQQQDVRAQTITRLINSLFSMRQSPGVNLKPKARKAILIALLTNTVWFEVGYTQKENSSEQALQDLQRISKEIQEAKNAKEIERLEAELLAIEERIEFLSPSGPFVRLRMPHQVTIDPDCSEFPPTNAKWIHIEDMVPTEYLNAVFFTLDKDGNKIRSVYEPTHIISENAQDETDEDSQTSLFSTDASPFSSKLDYSAYGFTNQSAFKRAQRTRVHYIWDKATRRLEMYHDKDWSWPIWVWEDELQLQEFFPLFPLTFHDGISSLYARGEVSYYLNQQDELNSINSERARARAWARKHIFFDKSILTEREANDIIHGPDDTAHGIEVPEGRDPRTLIFTIPPPSTNFAPLFDKQDLYQSIDRITAISDAMRGGELKTNTTNKAVDFYNSTANTRLSMRVDAIEDCIANIGWMLTQLCLRFMDTTIVEKITGIDASSFWKPIDPLTDFTEQAMICVGGSTQKPNKQARQQEALQVGQILAQFVRAAPGAVLQTTLKIFSKAFDDVIVSANDWEQIAAEVQQMITASHGGAPGTGDQPGNSPTQGGQRGPTQQPQPQPGQQPNPQQVAIQIINAMKMLPPEIAKAIGVALAQGASPDQILQMMAQRAQA